MQQTHDDAVCCSEQKLMYRDGTRGLRCIYLSMLRNVSKWMSATVTSAVFCACYLNDMLIRLRTVVR